MNNKLHPDIKFLNKRLDYLVKMEEYEIASRIKKWIDELIYKHSKDKKYVEFIINK